MVEVIVAFVGGLIAGFIAAYLFDAYLVYRDDKKWR
jgi:fructose-specific phosphotransferase system IIC component